MKRRTISKHSPVWLLACAALLCMPLPLGAAEALTEGEEPVLEETFEENGEAFFEEAPGETQTEEPVIAQTPEEELFEEIEPAAEAFPEDLIVDDEVIAEDEMISGSLVPGLSQEEVLTDIWVNPLYSDVVGEDDLIPEDTLIRESEDEVLALAMDTAAALAEGSAQSAPDLYDGGEGGEELISGGEESAVFDAQTLLAGQGYYRADQTNALSAEIKTCLKARQRVFTYGLSGADSTRNALVSARTALFRAMEHTGVPTEGDYIRYQLGGTYSTVYKYSSSGVSFYIATFTMNYYTDAAQEQAVDAAVASLVPALKGAGADASSRIRAAYSYLTDQVAYDGRAYTTPGYLTMYTGYAALIDHKAVCQGYAVALYRLLLEMGIDCRVIGGKGVDGSDTEEHAWNIVALGGKYYNADTTWDAGRSTYRWFLKCKDTNYFDRYHVRDSEYTTSAFYAAYPMALSDYAGNASVCPVHGTHVPVYAPAAAAGCESVGHTEGTVCAGCGLTLSGREMIMAAGHAYGGWSRSGSALFVKQGKKAVTILNPYVRTCARCGMVQNKYEETDPFISLSNIKKKTITLKKGKTKTVKVKYALGDKVSKFKSSKPKIVSVTKKGKLKARKKGKAKITVTLKSGLTKSFWVKVK